MPGSTDRMTPWRPAFWLVTVAALVTMAPALAPHDPMDSAAIQLADAFTPPSWTAAFPFGSDNQGRDILALLLHGLRLSLGIAALSVGLSLAIGVPLGLIAGWRQGALDSLITRLADIQLTFPAVLLAMLIDGVLRIVLPAAQSGPQAITVLVVAIGLANWVSFARVVRGSTRVEMAKTYVLAARSLGTGRSGILFRHILPNIAGPVIVLGTITLGSAIMTEATLSFLGIGLPPTQPSLGALISRGQNFLFSGEWWIAVLPGVTLALPIGFANLAGDRLRRQLGGGAGPGV